jgi:hypothetical protein
MNRPAQRPLLLLAVVGALAGCSRDRMTVVNSGEESSDFGHGDLVTAVAALSKDPASPQAFSEFSRTVDRLRPRFNQRVEREAERHLVFLAIHPLRATFDHSLETQMNELALTVWPTALRVEPLRGETAAQYVQRACATTLALECKYIIPEYWPLVINAMVWRRLKDRALESYVDCKLCSADPSFHRVLELYDEHERRIHQRRVRFEPEAAPTRWPKAGPHAQPWSNVPVLSRRTDGAYWFAGAPVDGAAWRQIIRQQRHGDVLGVHVAPSETVAVLRALLADARTAGYRELSLQVREHAYPFAPREYRISTGGIGSASRIRVRDTDTVQVLVQSLDAAAGRGGRLAQLL